MSERRKRDKWKTSKIEKKFKKGVAISRKIEYNVADVCKGDEVTDCSLAGEGKPVMDHPPIGRRLKIRHAGQKPSKSYLSTNKEEKEMASKKIRIKLWAYEHSLVDQAKPSASSRPLAAPAPRCPARSRFRPRRKS